jgi:hypothetical protein
MLSGVLDGIIHVEGDAVKYGTMERLVVIGKQGGSSRLSAPHLAFAAVKDSQQPSRLDSSTPSTSLWH